MQNTELHCVQLCAQEQINCSQSDLKISRRKQVMVKWLLKGDAGSREQPQTAGASKHSPMGKGWRDQGSAAHRGQRDTGP